MRILILVTLLLGVPGSIRAADAPTSAETVTMLDNRIAVDGSPVDPGQAPVLIRYGERTYSIKVSSPETADAMRKMKPLEALRAVLAFNRDLASTIDLDPAK